jgi:hypothetical protein
VGAPARAREHGRMPTIPEYEAWRRELIRVPRNRGLHMPTVRAIVTHAGDGSWKPCASGWG